MYCPQCGTEAQANVQYCRVCGSNLKVIGKAVSLSEAIARSDRGPLPKFREMVKNLKVDHVTDEVSRALDHMNQELAQIPTKPKRSKSREERRPWINFRKKKTAAERRENHITKGVVSMFSGVGLTVFLYFLSTTLILQLPPEIVGRIPFEAQSLFRSIWLIGLLPITSGMGHIIAGLLIRPDQEPQQLDQVVSPPRELTDRPLSDPVPMSVTDHTTNLLEPDRVPAHKKAQTTH